MKRNWLEWLVLAASAAAIAVLVLVLMSTGLRSEGRPATPTVALHVERARSIPGGWVVPATVRNEGDEAAQAVVLEASATAAGEEETSSAEIDYLPPGTEVEIEFAFTAEPDGEVGVRVVTLRPSR